MKKTLLCILVLALLLGGCGKPAEGTSDETTFFPESGATTSPGISDYIAPTAALGVESKSIYLVEPTWDVDLYEMTMRPYVMLNLISKVPVRENDIQVTIDIQTPYEVQLAECELFSLPTLLEDGSSIGGQFSYDLYLTYRGADWADLARLRAEAYAAEQEINRLLAEGTEWNDPAIAEQEQIRDKFVSAYSSEQENYAALTESQLPAFYAYQIQILFLEHPREETFTSLTLQIGQEVYPLEIGRVSLHPGPEVENQDYAPPGLSQYSIAIFPSLEDYLFNPGAMRIDGFNFTATEDLTLTGLYLSQEKPELQEIHVEQTSGDGASMDFFWDGASPLQISEGDSVAMDFWISDARLLQSGFAVRASTVMEYICQGEPHIYAVENCISYEPNWFALYATAFDGIDLGPYYTEYYYPWICGWTK